MGRFCAKLMVQAVLSGFNVVLQLHFTRFRQPVFFCQNIFTIFNCQSAAIACSYGFYCSYLPFIGLTYTKAYRFTMKDYPKIVIVRPHASAEESETQSLIYKCQENCAHLILAWCLGVSQQSDLIRCQPFTTRLLIIGRIVAASAHRFAIGVGVNCRLAKQFADVFVCRLLVSAQIEKLIAVSDAVGRWLVRS